MEEKRHLMFEITYERNGPEIDILSDEETKKIDEDEDFSLDDYWDDLEDDAAGGPIMVGDCSGLLREYCEINYHSKWVGDELVVRWGTEYRDTFLEWIMEYKDVDLGWDEDDEKKFIKAFFGGDVEKMKNWTPPPDRGAY